MAGTQAVNTLRFLSYNPTGLISCDKVKYVSNILCNYIPDFLFIQEHWLLDKQLCKLSDLSDKYNYHAVSGIDDCKRILHGRPFGGCAILYKKSFDSQIVHILSVCRRICAIRLQMVNANFLIINVYLPTDKQNNNTDELDDCLDEIGAIIDKYDQDVVIFGGDLNCDTRRVSAHVATLKNLAINADLLWCCSHSVSKCDYTYVDASSLSCSMIDHFLISRDLFNSVKLYSALHDGANRSGHAILYMDICFPHSVGTTRTCVNVPRPKWSSASDNDLVAYRAELDRLLHTITIPYHVVSCTGKNCSCCTSVIDKFAESIISCCLTAARSTIPFTGSKRSQKIPGWNDEVRPYRDSARFWYNIWNDSGRPRSGVVADLVRRTKAKYHYAIRKLKAKGDKVKVEKMAEAVLQNRNRNFFNEARKLCGTNKAVSSCIDDETDDIEIANLFGKQYKDLYNSVSCDSGELSDIFIDVNRKCVDELPISITCKEVSDAIANLRVNKRDGDVGLDSDHVINGSALISVYLSSLFTCMVRHGYVPDCLSLATIIPIVKNKKGSKSNSSNYRGIALASCIGKILDWIILQKYTDLLCTNDLQFGFKKGMSTNMCSMVLKETIAYYNSGHSDVFAVFLDATKAFDRVNYGKLFRSLVDRNLPANVVKLLLTLYTKQRVRIQWNGVLSEDFEVHNGVRQGGVLSPILFCVYIDNLFSRLEKLKVGCYIGPTFVGSLAYADDVTLLAPSLAACKKLLHECELFAREYDIKFNASKSQFIVFGDKRLILNDINIFIGKDRLERVMSVKHLGHVITCDLRDDEDITAIKQVFISQVNFVLCNFGHLSRTIVEKLFKAYCTSFYGSQIWSLNNGLITKLVTAYNTAIRKLLHLPYNTHRCLIYDLFHVRPLILQLHHRCIKFRDSCMNSANKIVYTVARNATLSRYTGSNIVDNCALLFKQGINTICKHRDSDEHTRYVEMLNE
jgi:hypothetical protein